jgi:hypothetical protein
LGFYALIRLQALARGVITRRSLREKVLIRLQALARRFLTRRSLRAKFGVRFSACDKCLRGMFSFRFKRSSKAIDGQQWQQEQASRQQLRGTVVSKTTWHVAPKRKVIFTMTETAYSTEGHCQIVFGTQPALFGKEWRIRSWHWEGDEIQVHNQQVVRQQIQEQEQRWIEERRDQQLFLLSLQVGHHQLEQRRRVYLDSFRLREEERRQQMERHRQLTTVRKRSGPHHGMAKCRQPTNQHHDFQRHTQESTSTIISATLRVKPRDQVIFIKPRHHMAVNAQARRKLTCQRGRCKVLSHGSPLRGPTRQTIKTNSTFKAATSAHQSNTTWIGDGGTNSNFRPSYILASISQHQAWLSPAHRKTLRQQPF